MSTVLRATTEQVAVAWLKGIVGDRVSTTLPKDNTTWSASGFAVVTTVGGAANMYVPLREPVVSVDCWAVNPDSQKPPWGKAAWLAERIQAGCYDNATIPRLLTLPAGYPAARVLSAYTAYEPRRVPDDASSYARFTLGLALHWVEVPS
ncbi:hypothetical protein ABZ419_11510 [Streptomyces cinnamoneus]|uniref:hypothetical protein n=1 Tax=Streptomyces cinnamoneus TaxID=53446 RepID=UPI0033EDC0D6